MKTNRYLSFCMVVLTAALLAGMVSCKKEKGPSELRAVMNDFATSGQKAYIDQEQYSCFVVGEKVRVNNSTGTITALERSDRQCVISGVAGLPEVTSFRAFYPAELLANQNVDLSNGLNNVAVTLPQEQVYETDANGNQIIKNPMMAELTGANENNSTLHFRNLCALLKITVRTQEAFDRITVSCDGMRLSGSGKINTSSGIIVMNSGSNSSVSLKLPENHVGSPAGECFYIMIPQTSTRDGGNNGRKDFTVTINTSSVKSFKRQIGPSDILEAHKIHTIGNFTFNAPMFSITSKKKVVFAPGNLQWSYSAMGTTHTTNGNGCNEGTWRFAEHQYDYVGIGNESVSATCSTWIDLFGYATSGNYKNNNSYSNNNQTDSKPYDISSGPHTGSNGIEETSNYFALYDWGRFNYIYNPQTKVNDPYKTWRTLTSLEWDYLLNTGGYNSYRNKNWWRYSNISFQVNSETIYGLIIYPDSITSKPSGINSNLEANTSNSYAIIKEDFDILESIGCAFLPSAGNLQWSSGEGYNFHKTNEEWGFYWTASSGPKYVKINGTGGHPQSATSNVYDIGYSVRLARDVQ